MDSTLAALASWMPNQRWYLGKGRTPGLRLVASWALPTDEPGVEVRTLLVADEGATPPITYQVPVVSRPTTTVGVDPVHAIGTPVDGATLFDGAHDAAFAAALLALVTRGGDVRGDGITVTGHRAASSPDIAGDLSASVLSGEQSNTSLIYRAEDSAGTSVICKLFRQVEAGTNPDIELQTALGDAGSAYVPRPVGWVDGEWPTGNGPVRGSLALAQEFLPGVQDAWRVALRAAVADEDFAERARALGAATADVHVSLASLFPAREATDAERAAIAASWRRRLDDAIAEVPGLAAHRAAIEAVYEPAVGAPWPPLQRIHGDYHLGQVLLVPDRGWVLLDFEGEPVRPLSERVLPDLAPRDVAGMLRSFDYVAGSIRLQQPQHPIDPVEEWTRTARDAFLDGYQRVTGDSPAGPLLDALELDKAVYEAIYEARVRPAWTAIPLAAVERLVARHASA